MTNEELLRRLREGFSVCPHEHEARRDEVRPNQTRYSLTCDEVVKFEVVLNEDVDPAAWFQQWGTRHELDVAKAHLLRVLEGREDTPSWREAVDTRLTTLEERVDSLDARLRAVDQRTFGLTRIGNALGGNR